MSEENTDKPPGKSLFKKGQSGNPSGRARGVPNRITTQMRETMHDLFLANKDKMQEKLNQLDAKDWMHFFVKLMPYFMPTLTATKSEITIKHTGAEHLESKELSEFIIQLNQSENEKITDTE